MKTKKLKPTWKISYPDGTMSIMNYDPVEFERDRILKIHEKLSNKLSSWFEYDKEFIKEVRKSKREIGE